LGEKDLQATLPLSQATEVPNSFCSKNLQLLPRVVGVFDQKLATLFKHPQTTPLHESLSGTLQMLPLSTRLSLAQNNFQTLQLEILHCDFAAW